MIWTRSRRASTTGWSPFTPFANGNGRHARMIADAVLFRGGRPRFTWGSANLVEAGEVRRRYIAALRAADGHDIRPLLDFVRS